MIGGGNAPVTVTSMTDSANNTWVGAGSGPYQGGDAVVQTYYAANTAPKNDLALSSDWNATDGDMTIFFYDIAGAATSPLDTAVGSGGTQNNAGNLTLPFTYTPSTPGEFVFVETMWDLNTGSGLLGGLFDTNTFTGESQSGPEPVDQNNGWGHFVATTTQTIDLTWTFEYPGLQAGSFAAMAAGFKSGANSVASTSDGGG